MKGRRFNHMLLLVLCGIISVLLFFWSTSTHSNSSADFQSFDVASNERFVFNPRTLQWTAINSSGQVVRTGHGSAGRSYCPDIHRSCRTPTGTFHVISKQGAGCKSSRYPVGKGGSPMPYCMYFTNNHAVHGSHEVRNYNASHGCIRIPPSDAKWLYYNFMKTGTTVVVKPY